MRVPTDSRDVYDAAIMAHTCVSGLYHVVFSTKDRLNSIPSDRRNDLWKYIGGIARANGMRAVAVGGTANHAHVLVDVPSMMPIAKAVQLIKGGSSKWLHETTGKPFHWQDGYGAFTVSVSHKAATVAYITGQEKHHAKRSFEEEFVAFLKRHAIEVDAEYLWG
jgi:REP element-mobilizing transposase RayT